MAGAGVLDGEERAGEVGGQHPVPLLDRRGDDRPHRAGAGRQHRPVQARCRRRLPRRRRATSSSDAGVARDGAHLGAVGRAARRARRRRRSRRSGLRPMSVTVAPSTSRWRAAPRPMPLPPPVIEGAGAGEGKRRVGHGRAPYRLLSRGPRSRRSDLRPMKATTAPDAPPAGDDWAHEVKWDGMRVLARCVDGDTTLATHQRHRRHRPVPRAGRHRPRPSAATPCSTARSSPRTRPGARTSACSSAACTCRRRPAVARRRPPRCPCRSRSSTSCGSTATTSARCPGRAGGPCSSSSSSRRRRGGCPPVHDDGPGLLAIAAEQGLEGIVSKRTSTRPYLPGKRTTSWRKVKVRRHQELVVGRLVARHGNRDGPALGSLAHRRARPGDAGQPAALRRQGRHAASPRELASGSTRPCWPPLRHRRVPVRPAAAPAIGPPGPLGAPGGGGRGRVRRVDRRGRAPPPQPPRPSHRQGRPTRWCGSLPLESPGGAEAAEAVARRSGRAVVDLRATSAGLDRLDDELGDAVAPRDLERLVGSRFTSTTRSSSR